MKTWEKKLNLYFPIILVILIMGTIYLSCCPRDLSKAHYSQDAGDLITAAHILGIAHPTGYPLFTMVGHLFTRLDFSIFSNEPIFWNNSPFKLNLFVILTSLVNLILFWRIHCLLQRRLGMRISGTPLGSAAAAFGAMALGTSYLYWSQTVVPEVYILNLFFLDLTLLIALRLMKPADSMSRPFLWFALFLSAGSGLFHHLSFMLFVPGFAILAACCIRKPTRKEIAWSVAGILISALPLLYLPIRSAMNHPLDTHNPEKLLNFWYLISARAYSSYVFGRPLSEMWTQLNFFDLGEQFGKIGAALICIGIIGAFIRRWNIPRAFLAFCLISTGLVLIHATGYKVMDRAVFFLPGFFAMAHLLGLGASLTLNYVRRTVRLKRFEAVRQVLLAALIIGAIGWQASQINNAYKNGIDVSESMTAKDYGSRAFAVLDEDAIIFTWSDASSFSLIYHRYVLFAGMREDVDIVFVPRIQTPWWWENVADGHPDVKINIPYTDDSKAIIEDIIRTNIDERPIYTAWALIPIPDDFKILKVGNIFRIVSTEEYERFASEAHGREAPAKQEQEPPDIEENPAD
jgi:hypothetical protein